jgi:hypothetical protein
VSVLRRPYDYHREVPARPRRATVNDYRRDQDRHMIKIGAQQYILPVCFAGSTSNTMLASRHPRQPSCRSITLRDVTACRDRPTELVAHRSPYKQPFNTPSATHRQRRNLP